MDAPPPAPPAVVAPGATLSAPGAVAPGGRLRADVRGLTRPIRLQQRVGEEWVFRGDLVSDPEGPAYLRVGDTTTDGRVRVRAIGFDGRVTPSVEVRVRPLLLAAVGDVNLGDGPGAAIERFGAGYPWRSVGPRLRRADITFANLECAVSTRGRAQEKTYTFRGRPSSLRRARKDAGIDVVNLANNHAGDFGTRALLDTLRHARAAGIVPVGAGATETAAYRPQVVERLGLRVAFVGFSTIEPLSFRALGRHPGTAWGYAGRVRDGVRRAARAADVVIATFHWGIERDVHESAEQRALARVAVDAGATAVIGAHPHVLQPIRRPPGRLIAYSLGNFVFSAVSPGSASTGILEVGLGRRRVMRSGFVRAHIVSSRPILGPG